MQKIILSGSPIYYRQGGTGPPLLLLHGWAGSSRYWEETIAQLSSIRTIYAPDLPGYGVSPPLAKPATPENITHLLVEFADALNLETFDINAHSLSAVMGVHIAVQWPERVRRLVLTCTGTYRDELNRKTVERVHRMIEMWLYLRKPWMGRVRLIYRTVARRFFYRVPADDGLLLASFNDFLAMDKRSGLETSMNAVRPDYNDTLKRVTVPTLVIGARQDNLMPHYGPPMIHSLVPNSTLVWIERCGHLPMIERSSLYHRLIKMFLTTENYCALRLPFMPETEEMSRGE